VHPSDRTGSSRVEDAIGRADDARRAPVEDVRVDHCRADVIVTQQLLDGADVAAILGEMRRKGVAQSIRILLMNRPLCGSATATIRSSAPKFT
jgi:hypothetical protein